MAQNQLLRQAKKVSQVVGSVKNSTSPLYSETTKPEFFYETKTTKKAKITKPSHAYKSYASTYKVDFFNLFNPELQLKDTESAIRSKAKDLLTELKGVKFVMILVLEFKKIESDDEINYRTFYLSSTAETIFNGSDISDVFESIYSTIISNIQKYVKGLGWIIDSVVDYTINISNYKPLSGSSYIKLPKKLNHPKKI